MFYQFSTGKIQQECSLYVCLLSSTAQRFIDQKSSVLVPSLMACSLLSTGFLATVKPCVSWQSSKTFLPPSGCCAFERPKRPGRSGLLKHSGLSSRCLKQKTTRSESSERWRPLSFLEKLLQPLQLSLAIWLLLLLPAGLASSPRRLCGGYALGSVPFEYMAFFLAGTIPRAWRFGRYARPAKASAPAGTRRRDFLPLGRS